MKYVLCTHIINACNNRVGKSEHKYVLSCIYALQMNGHVTKKILFAEGGGATSFGLSIIPTVVY